MTTDTRGRRGLLKAGCLMVSLAVWVITQAACGTGTVSSDQERQYGAADAEHIDSVVPLIRDSAINEYISSLGKRIAGNTSRANLDWRFQVVDSKEVNAFALPGGFVYVNRAVIEQADRMDELAGIMGHEIGHVVRRHSVNQLQEQQRERTGLVLLCTLTTACRHIGGRVAIAVGADAARAKYSQSDEAEADSEGVVNTVKAGINPEGLPSFFQRMLDSQKAEPTAVESFFSTHPTDQSRIDATRKQIESLHLDPAKPLQRDDSAFHAIQKRTRELPSAPPP
jgi:predicted Zn-dependent protease